MSHRIINGQHHAACDECGAAVRVSPPWFQDYSILPPEGWTVRAIRYQRAWLSRDLCPVCSQLHLAIRPAA